MRITFYFGPDKIPFGISDDGIVESASTMPFHGIISRGLLNKFIEHKLEVQLWHEYAHELSDSSNISGNPVLEKIHQYAEQCQVLSFGQSALSAQKYLEYYCGQQKLEDPAISLYNIKEGHTSSVWKVDIVSGKHKETFVLNVARDHEAGIELKDTSEKMKIIGTSIPDINLAKVLEIYILEDQAIPSNVVITRNEWIANAYEIHSRKSRSNGKTELLMVDRFLTSEDYPAYVKSVLGKIFNAEKTEIIQSGINDFLTKSATCLTCNVDINIYDGDVVWDGKKAVIVALS